MKNNKRIQPKSKSLLRSFPEIWAYVGLIFFCNLHFITGGQPCEWVFFPNANEGNPYLSIILHPFVHVTGYHLLLDGAGFFAVYMGLQQPGMMIRLGYVVFCGLGSVLLPLWWSSPSLAHGICGLSGIAHGLMAVSALEMCNGRSLKLGLCCFAIVFVKSIIEATSGEVLFSFLHFGLMGLPVASSHLGGVLGGCVIYGFVNNRLIKQAVVRNLSVALLWPVRERIR